jgi:hypothetical protein
MRERRAEKFEQKSLDGNRSALGRESRVFFGGRQGNRV